jgi:hypothetical protein
MQLTRGGCALWPVGDTVNHERASSADTFATIVIKHHSFFVIANQLLVEHIKQFQERRFVADLGNLVRLETTSVFRATLAPDLEREIL